MYYQFIELKTVYRYYHEPKLTVGLTVTVGIRSCFTILCVIAKYLTIAL